MLLRNLKGVTIQNVLNLEDLITTDHVTDAVCAETIVVSDTTIAIYSFRSIISLFAFTIQNTTGFYGLWALDTVYNAVLVVLLNPDYIDAARNDEGTLIFFNKREAQHHEEQIAEVVENVQGVPPPIHTEYHVTVQSPQSNVRMVYEPEQSPAQTKGRTRSGTNTATFPTAMNPFSLDRAPRDAPSLNYVSSTDSPTSTSYRPSSASARPTSTSFINTAVPSPTPFYRHSFIAAPTPRAFRPISATLTPTPFPHLTTAAAVRFFPTSPLREGHEIVEMKQNANVQNALMGELCEDSEKCEISAEFGFGVYLEYWKKDHKNSVNPKYTTLRRELTRNCYASISEKQYDDLARECAYILSSRSFAAKNIGPMNKICNIPPGTVMTVDHAICVKLYTDFNKIQRKFKRHCRRMYKNEPIESVADRNTEIAQWSRRSAGHFHELKHTLFSVCGTIYIYI